MLRPIPYHVRDHAGLILADTIAAILAGHAEPEVVATTARHATGGVALLGAAAAAQPPMAAFLTGFAGTAAELDEGNYAAGGHPAIHAVAAALPEAVARGASGAALLEAVIAGYEAGSRVGHATRLRPAAHPHGTWGVIGAAAAVAHLRGLDATRTQATLDLAASLGLATSVTAPIRGGAVRNIYAGCAAQNGLLAVDLAEAGVTGEPDGIAVVFGKVIGSAFDAARYAAGAERWFILESFLKLHACCRETQGVIEPLEALVAEAPVAPGAIDAVEVETFRDAAELSDRAPSEPIAGRFSIPYTAAHWLRHRSAWVEAYAPAALADPATRALAARITVREDPALTARQPGARIWRVTLRLADGTVRRAEVDGTAGDPGRPHPEAALLEKFRRCAEPRLGGRWAAAWEMARHPWRVPRAAELVAACRP